MSNTKLAVPPEFDAASKNQRIAFVQELWDRMAQDPENVPVPDSHKRVLDERLNAYRTSPQAGRSWSEVREQLRAKLGAP
jgi:putative addiction module component (TIGR02574 family)